MRIRGSKVEMSSVSNQPHEIKYDTHKEGTGQRAVKDAKKSGVNQRSAIEKRIK